MISLSILTTGILSTIIMLACVAFIFIQDRKNVNKKLFAIIVGLLVSSGCVSASISSYAIISYALKVFGG